MGTPPAIVVCEVMRGLLTLTLILVFLSGASTLGVIAAAVHAMNYGVEPETESVETDEFSSRSRTANNNRRKAISPVRRILSASAKYAGGPSVAKYFAHHLTIDLHTLHAVFRI